MDMEVKEEADQLRDKGNQHFKSSEYEAAITEYTSACTKYQAIQLSEWEGKTYCNISLSYLKLDDPQRAYNFAEKAVQLHPTYKAYYRRAQALEKLHQYDDSIEDYISSYQQEPLRDTMCNAIDIAAKHKLKLWGIAVTAQHQQYIQRSSHGHSNYRTELVRLCKQSIEEAAFGIIPLLKYVLRAEISCTDIVNAIHLEKHRDEVSKMLSSIRGHSDYLRTKTQTTTVEAELIKAAIIQEKSVVVELFLDELRIEGDVIDISDLLKETSLKYKPEWLGRLFKRGAHLKKCTYNPVKIILKTHYAQKNVQLEMIKLLVEKDDSVVLDMHCILHEVVKLTLQSQDSNSVHTLRLVCNGLNFETQKICNEHGQSPWHLALNSRQKHVSIDVCEVLKEYPIDPSLEDIYGKRADFGKKENDLRVLILREREAKMKEEEKGSTSCETTKGKRKRTRKACKQIEKVQISNSTPQKEIVVDAKPTNEERTALVRPTPAFITTVSEQKATVTLTHAEIENKLQKQLQRLNNQDDEYFQIIPTQKRLEQSSPTLPKKHDTSLHSAEKARESNVSVEEAAVVNDTDEWNNEEVVINDLDFDKQPWKIECCKRVMKFLSGKKRKHLKSRFCKKMMTLAQGDFKSEKRCKSVSHIRGLELYEMRLSARERIIWQIVPQFLPPENENPRIGKQVTKKIQESEDSKRVYTDVIRVWDIVLDHDNIHDCVENIEKNAWERGLDASQAVRANLKCISRKSTLKTNTRLPRIYESDEMEHETVFIPPINPEGNTYTIARLYSFSTSVVKLMLRDGDIERAFPYKEWPEEHDIVNMNYDEAILLLGRSGTGKTTCCLYRLWNEFKHYWKQYGFECIPKRQLSIASDTENAVDKDNDLPEPLPTGNITDGESQTAEDDCDITEENAEKDDHLHQIFVTKNYVLCSRLKKQFYKFVEAEDFAKNHMQQKNEELPCVLTKIHDLSYPLFLTARQFYILLDYSIHDGNYYFKRDEHGNMEEKIISTDYDHEDIDTLYDLEDSEDEEEAIPTLYPAHRELRKKRTEVTALYFDRYIWPIISSGNTLMSSLMVWMEIKSFIKGSREAIESETGSLTKDEYEKLGRKAAPHFAGNREEVYQIFESYKLYIQNNPSLCLFDECDLVHHIFKRLPKVPDKLEWALHRIYIDEVQDFTQGELWLMMNNCRDPNGFFFTGDTAQSIMSGIAFRFEDVKTLFHHMQQESSCKVVVPKVHHLTTNYRAHSGILHLASSVTDVLKEYFPYSFDHKNLPREKGLVHGPKPVILHECTASDLAVVLAGHKQTTAMIDFGAHQAILVRNQEAKTSLPPELETAIVLTIFESKGLEFDDVLLYNFFTNSDCSEEWRVLAKDNNSGEYMSANDAVDNLPSEFRYEKPHPLEFAEERHKKLCSELKHLYTAITRTKAKLWFYESDTTTAHHPVLWYWKQHGNLVEVKKRSETIETYATSSTPDDWKARGDEFSSQRLWEVAKKCYKNATCAHKVRECEAFMHLQGDQPNKYLLAAMSFLECDEIEHTPTALEMAAKCLHKGKQYKEAGDLYRKLREVKKAMQCYKLSNNFDQYIDMMDAQHRYIEAVETVFLAEKHKAVKLASRYIKEKCVMLSELKEYIVQHGMRLIKQLSAKGHKKEELLEIIDIIEPKLKIPYLKQVGAYTEASGLLKALGKTDDAYTVMLTQAMYRQALDLAKELQDGSKIHRVLFLSTKSMLSSCGMPPCHTVIPDLQAQLEQLCQSDTIEISVKGMGYLLLSRLTMDDNICKEALELFIKAKNCLGECEAHVILQPTVKKDIKYIEKLVRVCVETKKICNVLKTVSQTHTANFTRAVHQVEDFYGLMNTGEEYYFPLHQDMWNIYPYLHRPPSMQIESSELLKAICCHLESNIMKLMDNEVFQPIQNVMESYKFHHKQFEEPSNYDHKRLREYIDAYSMSLEIAEHRQASHLNVWKKHFLDLFKINGLLYLRLDVEHFLVLKSFPNAVGVLKQRLESRLKVPINRLNMDDWMEMWLLSKVINGEDTEVTRVLDQCKKSEDNKHHFVTVKNKGDVPHFKQWIFSCYDKLLLEIMNCFDQINSQSNDDMKLLESCFSTLRLISSDQAKMTAMRGIQQILNILIGANPRDFNILQRAVQSEQESAVSTCIALALTLLGNLSLSNLYKPSDLLNYQHHIFNALQPILDEPGHKLKTVCEKFVVCTSSRDLFALVQKLNQVHRGESSFHGVGSVSDLFLLQITKNGFKLTPTYTHRISENSILPIRIKTPTITASCKPDDIAEVVTILGIPEEQTNVPLDTMPRDNDKLEGNDPVHGSKLPGGDIKLPDDSSDLLRKENGAGIETISQKLGKQNGTDIQRLNSNSSNQDEYDEDEDFEIDELMEPLQRQISIDKTIADDEFCRACYTKLEESSLREHVVSEEHKRMEIEYKNFIQTVERVTDCKHEWEEEMGKLRSLDESIPLAINIHTIQEQIEHLDKIQTETERSGHWKSGEEELTRANENVKTLIQETYKRMETLNAANDVAQNPVAMDIHSDDEEEFSDIESDQVMSKRERRKHRREKKSK